MTVAVPGIAGAFGRGLRRAGRATGAVSRAGRRGGRRRVPRDRGLDADLESEGLVQGALDVVGVVAGPERPGELRDASEAAVADIAER